MNDDFWLNQQDLQKDEEFDKKEFEEEDLSEIDRDYDAKVENEIETKQEQYGIMKTFF